VNLPVTFTATVKASTGTAIPTGVVVFIDRSTLLDVVNLDSAGHAVFTTSSLAVGLHAIRAFYIGESGFLDSQSPEIFELVRS
jgi:hypothetical protein